jgi:glycolate oxidase
MRHLPSKPTTNKRRGRRILKFYTKKNKNIMIEKKYQEIYEKDASQIKGKAKEVHLPKNIEEIRELVKNNKRVLARGAGSGFCGGCVPQEGKDVVIDFSKMNAICQLDKGRKTIEVEPGVILEDLQRRVQEEELHFPIEIASGSIATIGGMVATNAGGWRRQKYSKIQHWISWVDIMDETGTIERKGLTEISDYCGMEGITGIIIRKKL